jgi:hypothetical protein
VTFVVAVAFGSAIGCVIVLCAVSIMGRRGPR